MNDDRYKDKYTVLAKDKSALFVRFCPFCGYGGTSACAPRGGSSFYFSTCQKCEEEFLVYERKDIVSFEKIEKVA